VYVCSTTVDRTQLYNRASVFSNAAGTRRQKAYVEYFEFVASAQPVAGEYGAQAVGGHVQELLVAGDLREPVVDELEQRVAQLRQALALGDGVVQDGCVGAAPSHHVRHTLAHQLAQRQLVRTRQHLHRQAVVKVRGG